MLVHVDMYVYMKIYLYSIVIVITGLVRYGTVPTVVKNEFNLFENYINSCGTYGIVPVPYVYFTLLYLSFLSYVFIEREKKEKKEKKCGIFFSEDFDSPT